MSQINSTHWLTRVEEDRHLVARRLPSSARSTFQTSCGEPVARYLCKRKKLLKQISIYLKQLISPGQGLVVVVGIDLSFRGCGVGCWEHGLSPIVPIHESPNRQVNADAFHEGQPNFAVQKAVQHCDKETLEWGEEMRGVGPKTELPGRPFQRSLRHVEEIRNAKQRQQNHRRPDRFPCLL